MWYRGQDSNLRRRMPTDLQSVVFDRSTTPAYVEPLFGIEPKTYGLQNRRSNHLS